MRRLPWARSWGSRGCAAPMRPGTWAAASFVEEGHVLAPQGLQLPEGHLLDDLRDAADEAWPAPVALDAREAAESPARFRDARHDRGLAVVFKR